MRDKKTAPVPSSPHLPAADGVSIDGFSTWWAIRFAVLENGFKNGTEDS